MKLYYSHNLNPRVAVAAARHLQAPVEFVRAAPRHPAQREAFLPINPNALVPVLEEGAGQYLWETDAIVCRLSALMGSEFWVTGAAQPEMVRWLSWAAYHLNRAADPLYFERVVRPRFAAEPWVGEAELAQAMADFRSHAAVLEGWLAGRQWLVADRLSYADFRVASALPFAAQAGLPLEEFPEVARWHGQLMALEAWRAPFDGLSGDA